MARNLSLDQLEEIAGGASFQPNPIFITPPICEWPTKPPSHDIEPVEPIYPTPIDPYFDVM